MQMLALALLHRCVGHLVRGIIIKFTRKGTSQTNTEPVLDDRTPKTRANTGQGQRRHVTSHSVLGVPEKVPCSNEFRRPVLRIRTQVHGLKDDVTCYCGTGRLQMRPRPESHFLS